MSILKNNDHLRDPEKIVEAINKFQEFVQQPQYELTHREDVKVNFRVDERMAPAMFKPDPLIPYGYVANSLTLRAMRSDIFVLGESIEDLSAPYQCACGQDLDVQFWKLCPYCARAITF